MASSNHTGVHSGNVSYALKERKTRQEWVFGATASLESSDEGRAGAEKWKLKQCNEFWELHKVWHFWNEKQKMWKRLESCAFMVLHFTLQILYFLGWRLLATLHWGSLLTKFFNSLPSVSMLYFGNSHNVSIFFSCFFFLISYVYLYFFSFLI